MGIGDLVHHLADKVDAKPANLPLVDAEVGIGHGPRERVEGRAVIGYQRLGTSDVSGSLAGYQVIDSETASVTISVTRSDPSRPVDCIVRVRARDGGETGRREVLVPPSEAHTVQVTTTVKSARPPAMADIYGCGADVPAYLRAA